MLTAQLTGEPWKPCAFNDTTIDCRERHRGDQLQVEWRDGLGGLWRLELFPQGNRAHPHRQRQLSSPAVLPSQRRAAAFALHHWRWASARHCHRWGLSHSSRANDQDTIPTHCHACCADPRHSRETCPPAWSCPLGWRSPTGLRWAGCKNGPCVGSGGIQREPAHWVTSGDATLSCRSDAGSAGGGGRGADGGRYRLEPGTSQYAH